MLRIANSRKTHRLARCQQMVLRSAACWRRVSLLGARRHFSPLPLRALRLSIRLGLTWSVIQCLLPGFLLLLLAGCALTGAPASQQPSAALGLPQAATPTPFQPLSPTQRAEPAAGPTLALPVTGSSRLTTTFQGIALDDASQPVQVLITPITASVNHGRPVAIRFWPGQPCAYEDHRACVSAHRYEPSGAPVTLVTVHSGVGGEGQALRSALEGTGVNRAGFSLEQIAQNQYELQDSAVALSQGQARGAAYRVVENLRVLAVVRVPAGDLETYFSTPFAAALDQIAGWDAPMKAALSTGRPLLILETCGWRHPEEAPAPGVTDTTGAIYLLVIG